MFTLIILFLIVAVANFTETVSGFGSILIAVAWGSNFYPLELLVPVLVPVNLLLSSYLVIKYKSKICLTLLTKEILPFMTLGFFIGLLIFNYLQGSILKNIFGLVIFVFSLKELFLILKNKNINDNSTKAPKIWVLLSGIIHGIYACGGPFLVYYVSKLKYNKHTFRTTLSLLWLILNIFLILNYIKIGSLNFTTLKFSLKLVPALFGGIAIGEITHKKINEKMFKTFVYSSLLIATLILIIS